MSKILTPNEASILSGEKHDLMSQALEAKTQGASDRISKQIMDIQRQLDDDLNERRRTGWDETREQSGKYYGMLSHGHANRTAGCTQDELRAFVTPGSPTRDLWVKPSTEMTMGTPAQLGYRADFLTTDTATIGSNYYFTKDLYSQLVMGLLEASGVLEAQPTIIQTDHVRPIQVPRLLVDATATAGVEGSPATEANPTGAHIDLGAWRIDGAFNVSIEMLLASELNLEKLLSQFAVRSCANKVAAYLALGAGTTEPLGLFTSGAVTVGKTGASQTTLSTTELIEAFKALPKGYRKQAHVVTSDVLHTDMLQRVNDNGDYVFHTLEGGGETFMAKPLHVEPWADQTSMTAGEVHAIMGDFGGYFVRQGPFFFRRNDADPLNPQFVFATWLDSQIADAGALVSAKTAA